MMDITVIRMKELREKRGLSIKEAAERLELKYQRYFNYEKGEREPPLFVLRRMADLYGVSLDYLLGKSDIPIAKPLDDGDWIPVLGKVAAGIPISAIQEVEEWEQINRKNSKEYFGLKIKGDSMMPRINDGDVVIVHKQSSCDDGDIAVVLINGDDATIKKIKKGISGITLIPLNPSYEPIYFSNEEIEKMPVTICGKVVELRAKFA